jgi:cell division inhibitor SepF
VSLWQKTLFYLGLVDEDEAADTYEPEPESPTRRHSSGEHSAVEAQQPRRSDRREPRETQEPVYPGVSGRRVDPPLTTRRRTTADTEPPQRYAEPQTVRTIKETSTESQIITASSFSDAQQLADHIRASIPVVLDLRQVEPAMVRRLVDFASGLTYALSGSMRKIGQGVILVSPANVNVSRDERHRLADLGYYQAPDSG